MSWMVSGVRELGGMCSEIFGAAQKNKRPADVGRSPLSELKDQANDEKTVCSVPLRLSG
jgi:hypothetical protein